MTSKTVLVETRGDKSLSGCLLNFSRTRVVHVDSGKTLDLAQLYNSKRVVLWFIRRIGCPVAIESLTRLQARLDQFREQGLVVAVIGTSSAAELAAAKKARGFEMEMFSETSGLAYAAFPDFKYLSPGYTWSQKLCCCFTSCFWYRGWRTYGYSKAGADNDHMEIGGVLVVEPANSSGTQSKIVYSYAQENAQDSINIDKLLAASRAYQRPTSPSTPSKSTGRTTRKGSLPGISRTHTQHNGPIPPLPLAR